jgi:O-antigen/teichoic acid export membrane protein
MLRYNSYGLSLLLKLIIKNISWLFSEKLLSMLVALVTMWVLARQLGPSDFGTLSYLLAIIAMLGPIVALGLNSIIVRELINHPQSKHKIISTIIGFRMAGAVFGALLCFFIAFFAEDFSSLDRKALAILGLAGIFNGLNGLEFWFQAKVAAGLVAKMRTSIVMLFSVLKISAALSSDNLLLLITIFAVEQLVLGLGFVLIYVWEAGAIKVKEFDWSYGLSLLKQSFWLVLSGIAAIIYLKIDQIMLGQMVGREAVGIYSVAARLSEVWYFFATAVVVSVFPALLIARSKDTSLYYQRLQQVSDLLFISAVLSAIGVSLFAPMLIPVVFGEAYSESASILIIHIWAGLFVFMRALVSKWLIAEHLLKFSLVSHGTGAVINVAANYLLIPSFGGIGAAYATVLSYAIASYVTFWLHPSTIPIAKVMTHSLILPLTFGRRYWSLLR